MSREYNDSDIDVIRDDIEKIKNSHGVYIGADKFDALLHLTKEIIQNSTDELNEDSNGKVIVEFNEKNNKEVTIIDNGRGIPLHSIIDVATITHSSGKFNKGKNKAYAFAAGTHGVGLTATNALSNYCIVEVHREGLCRRVEFEFGHLVSDTTTKCSKKEHGTKVIFSPNEEILGKIKCDNSKIFELCELMAYLTKVSIDCTVISNSGKILVEKFEAKKGLVDLLHKLVPSTIVKPIVIEETDKYEGADMQVQIVFTYSSEIDKSLLDNNGNAIISYANFCTTIDHGSHVQGFKQGLSNVLLKYVKDNLNKREKKLDIIADDIRDGLVAIVNVNTTAKTIFNGQKKEKLMNDEMVPFVKKAVTKYLSKWIKEHNKDAEKIADWIKAMCKARMHSSEEKKAIVKTKGYESTFSKDRPKKWHKANGKEGLELFIIEGESAAGSAVNSRNKEYQELFELRGVPLNSYGESIPRILTNAEIKGLVTIIGTGIGKNFDMSKCRYEKIIVMSDSDSDGGKITSLLCAFFIYHMPQLVEAGKIYKVVPPLYKIMKNGKDQFLKDNKDYANYMQKLISDNMKITHFIGKKEVKLSKDDITNIIVNTNNYARKLKKISKSFICNKLLLELVANNYDLLENEKYDKLQKKLNKEFSEVYIEDGAITGFANKESQYIILNKKNLKKIESLYEILHDVFDNELQFKINGDKVYLCELLKIFKDYEPKHKQRYKGLTILAPYISNNICKTF